MNSTKSDPRYLGMTTMLIERTHPRETLGRPQRDVITGDKISMVLERSQYGDSRLGDDEYVFGEECGKIVNIRYGAHTEVTLSFEKFMALNRPRRIQIRAA